MGFMDKVKSKLIEEAPRETEELDLEAIRNQYGLSTESKTEASNTAGTLDVSLTSEGQELIDDIYNADNIKIGANTIYKIEELRAALPEGLPTETKKQTVLGLLPTIGITVEDVNGDALSRINSLNHASLSSKNKSLALLEESEAKIEEYNNRIEQLYAEIQKEKKQLEDSTITINKEISRIEELVKFIL